VHALGRDPVGFEYSADGLLHFGIPDVDINVLHLHELPDQFTVNRGDGFVFVGEANAVRSRPGEPCGYMRFPLSRHAKAKLTGGRCVCCGTHRVRINSFARGYCTGCVRNQRRTAGIARRRFYLSPSTPPCYKATWIPISRSAFSARERWPAPLPKGLLTPNWQPPTCSWPAMSWRVLGRNSAGRWARKPRPTTQR